MRVLVSLCRLESSMAPASVLLGFPQIRRDVRLYHVGVWGPGPKRGVLTDLTHHKFPALRSLMPLGGQLGLDGPLFGRWTVHHLPLLRNESQ
jgi:hypothetical protein